MRASAASSLALLVRLSHPLYLYVLRQQVADNRHLGGLVAQALRTRHDCQLLKSNHTAEQVCAAVGYQSIAAFTRTFAKAVGLQTGGLLKAVWIVSRSAVL